MMRKIVFVFAALVVALAFNSAWAEDLTDPAWTRGSEGTTYQRWEFSNDSLSPPPDAATDPYPLDPPVMSIPDTWPNTVHMDQYLDMSGVWRLESPDDIWVTIQNYNDDNPFKYIWIQITYASEGGNAPLVLTNPGGSTIVSDPVLMGEHWYVTYDITISPNPICIPEPVTVCFLGLGALVLLRKRRP
jgi:hypothetical protein